MTVAGDITLTKFLELLSHPRRRFVLGVLDATDDDVAIDSLVDRLAAWERTESPEQAAQPDEAQIKVSLYHTHLPKLADAGIVTYDSTHVQYDAGETSPMDVSVDELLAEEREKMLQHCC